jgi:ParB family chromosome partitioning protein
VRALEELVTLGETGSESTGRRTEPRPASPQATELAERLSDHFETRVRVDLGKTKGRITIEFASVEDMERIVATMRVAPEGEG